MDEVSMFLSEAHLSTLHLIPTPLTNAMIITLATGPSLKHVTSSLCAVIPTCMLLVLPFFKKRLPLSHTLLSLATAATISICAPFSTHSSQKEALLAIQFRSCHPEPTPSWFSSHHSTKRLVNITTDTPVAKLHNPIVNFQSLFSLT